MASHALPSLSLSLRLGVGGMALCLGGREEVRLVCIYVKLAPPTLGAWSVAGLLGQPKST